MINLDQLAIQVHDEGVARLYKGVHPELLQTNPELGLMTAGYWAMVRFLLARGAMLVGNVADPSSIVKHLGNEKNEAKTELANGNYDALRLELGDVNFLGLVIGGLLWLYISKGEKKWVSETLVWSRKTAYRERIDLDKAVVWAAEKNVRNYQVDRLKLLPGERVRDVVERLPGVYAELRARRNNGGAGREEVGRRSGYSHEAALASDTRRWSGYDR